MGTKLGLHSADFLDVLTRRQLLLSLACAIGIAISGALAVFAEAGGYVTRGAPVWWVVVVVAAVLPIAIGASYAWRAGDLEDESLGIVDVDTLPSSSTAGIAGDPPRERAR